MAIAYISQPKGPFVAVVDGRSGWPRPRDRPGNDSVASTWASRRFGQSSTRTSTAMASWKFLHSSAARLLARSP